MMKSEDFSYCQKLARKQDYGRYLGVLTAPAKVRGPLFVLLALNDELGRIGELVSEPTLGEIRLQWWRQLINGEEGSDPGSHPVGLAVRNLMEAGVVSASVLADMVDGRSRDMDPTPFSSVEELEAWLDATSGSLARAGLQALEVDDKDSVSATTEVAIAWGMTGFLRSVPFHEHAGRRKMGSRLLATDILERTDDLLIAARGRGRKVSGKSLPLLYLARLCDLYVRRFRQSDGDIYRTNLELAPVTPIWQITLGRITGRY